MQKSMYQYVPRINFTNRIEDVLDGEANVSLKQCTTAPDVSKYSRNPSANISCY